jgi:C_GCAxxG_C_C family probable redox protein
VIGAAPAKDSIDAKCIGETLKTKCDIAAEKYLEGYNCAQSVFFSFCGDFRIDEDMALKMSCGFGGGMGRKQEVCGAVTGGIIAIGLKYGRGKNDDSTATELTYAKTRELVERFSAENGSFICRKLLDGCELATEEGHKRYKENDCRNKICAPCIQSAVRIVESIL